MHKDDRDLVRDLWEPYHVPGREQEVFELVPINIVPHDMSGLYQYLRSKLVSREVT